MTQTSTAIPNWERRGGQALGVLLAAFVALHFYNALFGQFEPLVQRPIFIGFGIGGAFFLYAARASRTVPFVSKASGVPLASVAARCMAGISLQRQHLIASNGSEALTVDNGFEPYLYKLPG